MGPKQSRMAQRSARATSTLPHVFFEAPGAMVSRSVPCPGRRDVLCRVCCAVCALSVLSSPQRQLVLCRTQQGLGGNETCPSLPQRETRAASRPQLPPHREKDQLSQTWPLPLSVHSWQVPTQVHSCQAVGTGTSEPAPFLGKASRDGGGRDHKGHAQL